MTLRMLFCLWIAPLMAGAAEKPNLLMLFADDMTWRAVRSISGEDIDTPNLDRLAARGMTFTHAYNSGAWHGAVCVASRTMLMTGRQVWRAREAEPTLQKEWAARGRLWPQQLAAAGYRTCFSGKWHIECKSEGVFHEILHPRPSGMPKDGPLAYERPVEGKEDPWDPADPKHSGYWEGGRHWSEVVADDFESFLAKDDDRPWFVYLAFNAPHDPRQAPQEILDRYAGQRIRLPENFLPVYPHREAMGAPQSLRDENLAPTPRTPFAVTTHRREYYAIITHLDLQIGRILDALDASPEGKSTYVCFTADQGLACGEHGLMGKQNLYDHSVRVPFILAGPDIPQGRKSAAPVYLQDIMPTYLALAGAEVPADLDFRDLRPVWEGKSTGREAVYGGYKEQQRMLVKDGHKLLLYPKAGVFRVFDLREDPWEMKDLAATDEGRRVARGLFAALLEEQGRMHDKLDLRSVYPDLAVGG